jgi:hypothetical protein
MSLASFSAQLQAMTWIGVGNVEGLLLRADAHARPSRESLPLRSGVVGYRLPPLRATALSVTRGDMLILASDGIRSSFLQEMPLGEAPGQLTQDRPQDIADRILAQYGQDTDDALVLVARYLGTAP